MENRRQHSLGASGVHSSVHPSKSPVPSPRQLAEATSTASIMAARNAPFGRTEGRSRLSRSKSPSSSNQTRTRSRSHGRALLEEVLAGQSAQRTYHLPTTSAVTRSHEEEEQAALRASLVTAAMEAKAAETSASANMN